MSSLQRPPRLEAGKKYRFRYQVPGVHRVPREMVAMFLSGGLLSSVSLSGRPAFGTTELKGEHISEVWPMPDDAQPYADRKVK